MTSVATIADMVRAAEKHADDMSPDRLRAIEYYDGKMEDTEADEGRSSMVSKVLREQVKKLIPSLRRTLLGSDVIVEYQPAQEGDEQGAAQATDYVNAILAEECNIRRHVEDALHDASIVRNGILRWWWDERVSVKTSMHTGLTEAAFAQLVAPSAVEILEHSESQEIVEIEGQEVPVILHDVRIKRRVKKSGP